MDPCMSENNVAKIPVTLLLQIDSKILIITYKHYFNFSLMGLLYVLNTEWPLEFSVNA